MLTTDLFEIVQNNEYYDITNDMNLTKKLG